MQDKWNRWHLVQLTPEAAMEHDRRVYNVGENEGLGWKPYTYCATRGAVAQFACHTEDQLVVRLGQHDLIVKEWSPWRDGIRCTELISAEEDSD